MSSAILFPHLKPGQAALLCLEDVQAPDLGRGDGNVFIQTQPFYFSSNLTIVIGFKLLLQHSFAPKCHLCRWFCFSFFLSHCLMSPLFLHPSLWGLYKRKSCVLYGDLLNNTLLPLVCECLCCQEIRPLKVTEWLL